MTQIKPFVKWAGGKGQLLSRIIERLPQKFDNYFEPFVGGGALLFELKPKQAYINDINSELINTYTQIKQDAAGLLSHLSQIDDAHVGNIRDYYYQKRSAFNKKIENKEFDTEMASLFIYINKHCFNGLYRVNRSGFFNVPFNQNKAGNSYDEANILEISKFLAHVCISNIDFEELCAKAKKNDFIFFDSPYAPLNNTSFESYTKEGFTLEDHIRLAKLFRSLSKKGVFCMLTNHNTPLICDLYGDFKIEVVQVKRLISSDSTKRIGEEVIITNY